MRAGGGRGREWWTTQRQPSGKMMDEFGARRGWPRRTGGVLAPRFKGDERSARGVVRISAARGPTRAWGAAAPERLWNGLNAPGPRSTRVGTRGCPPQVLRPAGQERRDSGVGLEGPAGDLSLLVLCQSVAWPVDPDGQSAIKELGRSRYAAVVASHCVIFSRGSPFSSPRPRGHGGHVTP